MDYFKTGHHPPTHLCNGREFALMTALSKLFLKANELLCRCHISKHIFAKQQRASQTQENFEHFIQDWNMLMKSSTEPKFNSRPEKMRVYLPIQKMHYIWH